MTQSPSLWDVPSRNPLTSFVMQMAVVSKGASAPVHKAPAQVPYLLRSQKPV